MRGAGPGGGLRDPAAPRSGRSGERARARALLPAAAIPPARSRRAAAMDSRKLSELRAFVRLCKQNPALLHSEELAFLREWLERCGDRTPGSPGAGG